MGAAPARKVAGGSSPPRRPASPRGEAAPRRRAAAPARRTAAPADRSPASARKTAVPARTGGGGQPRGAAVLDKLLHGRGWIAIVFVLLAGIVFFNVDLLQMNRQIAQTAERAGEVKRENARLRTVIARLGSSERIQEVAAQAGLVLPAPGEVRYLRSSPSNDARRAAERLEAEESSPPAEPAATQPPVEEAVTDTPVSAVPPAVPEATAPTEPAPVAPAEPAAGEPVAPIGAPAGQ